MLFIGAEVFNNICQEIQAHQDTSHRKGQIYHAHWDSDSGADILHGNSYDITAFYSKDCEEKYAQ